MNSRIFLYFFVFLFCFSSLLPCSVCADHDTPREPSLGELSFSQKARDQLAFSEVSFLDKIQKLTKKIISCFCKQPKRLYFVHIPKTGGNSLHTLLENQVDLKDVYPPRRLRTINPPVKHQFVSAHIPYWACLKLDQDFENAFKVTILRHPIEKYLSTLRYKKKKDARFREWDLLSIYHFEQQRPHLDLDLSLIPNSMCRFLTNDPNLTGKDLLENAKKTLDSFDSVLFLDNFEEDLKNLCQRIGIDLEKHIIPHLNTTTPEEVDKEFIEKIKAENNLDLELYEYAKTHLKRKNTTYQFLSSFPFSRKVKKVHYKFSMALNGSGWCYRENVDRFSHEFPIYRWVMDKPANIFFNLEKGRNYTLTFRARVLTSDIFPRVLINGTEVPVQRKTNEEFSKFRLHIPKKLITKKPTEITFFSPQSYKFNEVHRECIDDRKLSFAVNRIKIYPAKRL